MAKAPFDITNIDLKNIDLAGIDLGPATKPIYAGVGVTDLAVAHVRELVADVQKKVGKLDLQPKALRDQAVTVVNSRVSDLQADAKAYPAKVQGLVESNVATAAGTYDQLVKRGETLVKRIGNQETTQAATANAKTTTAKAKTTGTQAKKAATTARKSSATTARTTTSAAKKSSTGAAKSTAATARKSATATSKAPARKASTAASSAKATGTAAKKTATSTAQATQAAAKKVGD